MKNQILNKLMTIKREGVTELINFLTFNSDFFTAPCSTKYHNNFEGGLAIHSWNVYKLFKEKNERYKLKLNDESIIICGLLHDLCKVGFYKWTGNEYIYDDKFPIGHGEKSVIIIQRFIKLTEEECCIIRFHMANFDLSEYNKQIYYNAINMYPATLALFIADYEATTFLESKNGI
jgi:HD superfamily phosphohydrolase YqeK